MYNLLVYFSFVVFIFIVYTEFGQLKKAIKIKNSNRTKSDFVLLEFIRPLTFFLLVPTFIPTPFEPNYVAMYDAINIFHIPPQIILAMPLSATVCGSAIFASIAGYIKYRIGLKVMIWIGSANIIIGFSICCICTNLLFYTFGKFIVGMGLGFVYVVMNTIIAGNDNDKIMQQGYSNYYASYFSAINVGCILGGAIATLYSYQLSFFIAMLLALLALAITIYLTSDNSLTMETATNSREAADLSFYKFIFNRKVFALLFFVYFPYLISSYFLYYFFPLFSFNLGMDDFQISQIFLFNGLFVVYLGPWLTPKLTKRFGYFKSTILGSCLCIGGMSLFIIKPTLEFAVLTVLVLGLADSFAYTAQTTYYNNLVIVREFGISKANGIKSSVENFSYMFAPFIFSSALLIGTVSGILLISSAMLVFLGAFSFSRGRKER